MLVRTDETTSNELLLVGSDRSQPAGRVMALALATQIGVIASYSTRVTKGAERSTEGLHDYRVALRRTKTLLLAAEAVFPAQLAQSGLNLVSAELRSTTGLRNLDVVADSLRSWSDYLSPSMQSGLKKLQAEVEAQRRSGNRDLARLLENSNHLEMLDKLRILGTVYRLGGEDPGTDALVAAGRVAKAAYGAACEAAGSAGRVARGSKHVDDWHRLRRRLKRVSYLLEAFGPILEEGSDGGTVNKQVKKLLRDLGELQDMTVEAAIVRELGATLGTKAAMTSGAILNSLELEIPSQIQRSRKRWKKLRQVGAI